MDLQLTIAEVAVAVAGFSAIVVALNGRPVRQWDELDRHNPRMLIQVAFFTLVFSILPSVLAASSGLAAGRLLSLRCDRV